MNMLEAFKKYPLTDKSQYADFYQRHFAGLKPTTLLEIGVLKGASLRAWQDIFPDTKIVGIDIDQAIADANKDLTIYIGDQIDKVFLDQVIAETGIPDIIIDDGGHCRSQQTGSFIHLWQYLKSGGLYIIEDLGTSFLEAYNDAPGSAMDYICGCLYPLEWDGNPKGRKVGSPISYLYSQIVFEPNIVLVKKK